MNKERAAELWLGYVRSELDETETRKLEEFFADHPEVKAEFESLGSLWNRLDDIKVPEPSAEMDVKFQAMLSGYEIAQTRKENRLSQLMNFLERAFQSRMSVAAMMLLVGIGLGYLLNSGVGTRDQLTQLNSEVFEMKKMMMLTLLEQPRAMDRMKAVQISNEIRQPDEKIVEALLKTLNGDPNVNVRLVAAQSLADLADNPKVRSGLIQAISNQTSPVIQNALADIMIDLMEKRSVSEFEKLLQQQNLDTLVKEKIQTTLETLI